MYTHAFLLFCFLPLMAFSLPIQQAPLMVPASLKSIETFPQEAFTCYTTRYSPEISALLEAILSLEDDERIFCIPTSGSVDTKIAGLVTVEGTIASEDDVETCFLVESAVQRLISSCGYDERVGGELRLPMGDVVVRLGARMPLP
jgi:hypothetical protein